MGQHEGRPRRAVCGPHALVVVCYAATEAPMHRPAVAGTLGLAAGRTPVECAAEAPMTARRIDCGSCIACTRLNLYWPGVVPIRQKSAISPAQRILVSWSIFPRQAIPAHRRHWRHVCRDVLVSSGWALGARRRASS
eukprot:scaffold714_cov121-Isochrysis_galbana.AAC.14